MLHDHLRRPCHLHRRDGRRPTPSPIRPRRIAAATGNLFDQAAEVTFRSDTRSQPRQTPQLGVTPGDKNAFTGLGVVIGVGLVFRQRSRW